MKLQTRFSALSTLLLVLILGYSVSGQLVQHNGGIVTLNGDTINCTIVLKTRDVGIKPRVRAAYRHDYVVAEFNNDSIRIIYPGSIRAYFVRWFETKPEQVSWYVSDSIDAAYAMIVKPEKTKSSKPVFLHRLVIGGYYHLWYFEQPDPGSKNDQFFILEENNTGKRKYFTSTRWLKKQLSDWPGIYTENNAYKNWFTGKQVIVKDYNQYKAGK